MAHWDLIVYDDVGSPIRPSALQSKGMGGSEFVLLQVAEALAAAGKRVLVVGHGQTESGRAKYADVRQPFSGHTCDTLLISRYSGHPEIQRSKTLILCSDLYGEHYSRLEPLVAEGAQVLAVSQWQAGRFPARWGVKVVPNPVPDWVYGVRKERDSDRFVYASAALKGLNLTLECWERLRMDSRVRPGSELRICHPGYDSPDGAKVKATPGVRALGSLPFEQVVWELASSAGLFYANVFPETFCIVAALAEAVGTRVHVWQSHPAGGAVQETVSSPVASTFEEFKDGFLGAYGTLRPPPEPKDFRMSTVLKRWLEILG